MNLVATSIAGVFVVETAVFRDHRGDFKRLFCSDELGAVFGPKRVVQINHSLTTKKGAIRGLHYQFGPYSEMKMIQCLRGRIWDVAIDLRRDSATFLHWFGTELGPELNRALFSTKARSSPALFILSEHAVNKTVSPTTATNANKIFFFIVKIFKISDY